MSLLPPPDVLMSLAVLSGALAPWVAVIATVMIYQSSRLDKRFDDLKAEQNQRFDDLKAEQNQRFGQVDKRFDDLKAEQNQRFDQVDKRFDQQDKQLDRMGADIRALREALLSVKQ